MILPDIQKHPIADLHCDLLSYLCRDARHTPYDLSVRCAIPQLVEGHVKIQVLAIFSETFPGSSKKGIAQAECFKTLPRLYSQIFEHLRTRQQLDRLPSAQTIGILPAIENASALCEEDEDIHEALKTVTSVLHKIGKLAYISLTWNTENRFGGGAATNIGLKGDGKQLLEYLCEKNIPIDFSHASDALASDILNYLDQRNLHPPLLVSHSNMRSVVDVPRNLPDEIAKEILKRKGLIGLNLIRHFVGEESPYYFVKQLEHLLKLHGVEQACLGADFFDYGDLPATYRRPQGSFFPDFDNAACYPRLIELWQKNLTLSPEALAKICYHNVTNFLQTHLFTI